MINIDKLKGKLGLTSIVATAILTSAIATFVGPKPETTYILNNTKLVETDNGKKLASIWSVEHNPKIKRVLIPPYILEDNNGDKRVDAIKYSSDYTGEKLTQEKADALFYKVIN